MVRAVNTQDDFKKELSDAGSKLVVVDFHAVWCGPCKVIAPKIEAMEKDFPEVVFLKVDVDEVEDVAAEYKISAMPTFLFIKDAKKVDEVVGANEGKVREMLTKYK